ncbi:MAG: hypothetical protein A3B07_03575 [Candidatus Yonathbacteria bacterium RIFCSPLOWO2_01_FULL_43_27]|uniref:Uncharacterized protein n=2 Tax=Parcubacteria group TaxID=1794811 RepID=A0A1G2SDM6_9BACT|nr:MAG: hypothetical protein UW78_C0006G0015 [Candidatus Azambacteria bacterium GW2011_GWA1_44_9]OHA78861.1 MAG: hypothetical protein A2658_00530 [Candidatus Yonathbacteria bacterium RIFCSPHIGHO2_01_FULL_44_19]OHA82938.1 MAG: hypothetical protein A3B07_03575 [Candidatus Yonathbacteria bacterium RIFCSPLOWO2_01_FULL_43_27]
MSLRPLELNLNRKTLDEVVQILKKHGFTVSVQRTDLFDVRDRVLYGKKEDGPPVHVVSIPEAEAPFLTVTVFTGRRKVLKKGDDLYLFDRPAGHPLGPGQDWSALYTLDYMR